MKNASSEETCRRQAFARILSWQYFRLFQQNRPEGDMDDTSAHSSFGQSRFPKTLDQQLSNLIARRASGSAAATTVAAAEG
jgi:hypothetical protein